MTLTKKYFIFNKKIRNMNLSPSQLFFKFFSFWTKQQKYAVDILSVRDE